MKKLLCVCVTFSIALLASITAQQKLSYEGYELKWQEDFNGTSLDRSNWNVELHEKGWVNNELQEYVDSEENIIVKDGKLILKPVTKKGGAAPYTSGRVNTQGKKDFTYGIFECYAKVPEGKGFLPAFWMMPTNENEYGQWPRCGEIDIMEVLGNQTNKAYGTIHFGNPHSESQGSKTLKTGSFSKEFHLFSCEWEPGKISWYIDGELFHSENSWYSKTEGVGEISYPAPFDQPFYIILNLAVGGNWPGNPSKNAKYIDSQSFEIDYVKVYQKPSYNENVSKPEKKVRFKECDENGNYVTNGSFSNAEDLSDDIDWKFLTALGGVGSSQIRNNEIVISTKNGGTEDYSIQLIQSSMPLVQGATYRFSFKAKAKNERKMKVGISAPERGWKRYFNDTEITLPTEYKEYAFDFVMEDETDPKARIEFNMGKQNNTCNIFITDVSLIQTKEAEQKIQKKMLADGNVVFNGKFQEGKNRTAFWSFSNPSKCKVTSLADGRKLEIDAVSSTIIVEQKELPLQPESSYLLSFDLKSNEKCFAIVAGNEFELNGSENYRIKFSTSKKLSDKNLLFKINGKAYLDNIRIEEDSLIKNSSFSAGLTNYEVYVDGSANATIMVDSLKEKNAADITINNTGDQSWKIQLMQKNINLEKGKKYKLYLKAKSTVNRKMMIAIQRDGSKDNDWNNYGSEKTVDLSDSYKTFETTFTLSENNPCAMLSISCGAIANKKINQQHHIYIDDIVLEIVE